MTTKVLPKQDQVLPTAGNMDVAQFFRHALVEISEDDWEACSADAGCMEGPCILVKIPEPKTTKRRVARKGYKLPKRAVWCICLSCEKLTWIDAGVTVEPLLPQDLTVAVDTGD